MTPLTISSFLQHFSDEELLREINRREAEAKKKLIPITANIFFEVKQGDFKVINQDL